ncbi:hypothetical protein D9Y31_16955 [Acinetobacter baumannii]|uniref:hypothetical protein n=1 Tax=Acinetobacter baumannii TaxID=470 RepID=UPI000E2D80BB|nr:hypothetical protein [Acinetobacter baumannii]RDJ62746.1 hypothetical protein AB719_02260 [Acinetobacter baumannii]TKV52995.1 hypothetical protein D9Y30_17375 [Acinetobacter baumannii]TKV55636.1 hypothetical protein D9Y31_16955 [Acinetobacter baumannii]
MDKCREAFERFECEKYEANYDDMKKNWDWYESQFGYRYSPDSLRGKGWAIWQEAWQHQQAKVEELQTQLSLQRQRVKAFEEELTSSRNYGDELQKRVDTALKLMQKPLIVGDPAKYVCARFKEIEQALKGEGQ